MGGQTCDTGQCGFPPVDGGFGDAGLPTQCNVPSDCGANQCCDLFFGAFGFCAAAGQACLLSGVCDPSTLTCL
jgi:hypothetical protein